MMLILIPFTAAKKKLSLWVAIFFLAEEWITHWKAQKETKVKVKLI
jgi:hypothetical protein